MSQATATSWEGCQLLGIDTKSFTPAQIDDLPLTRETMVHGGVGMVRRALERLGVPQPKLDGMPPEALLPFFGRRVWATTMAEIRERLDREEWTFIKPLNQHKAFTGYVTGPSVSALARTAHFPDDFEICAQEIITFDVEYRLFVHDRRGFGKGIPRWGEQKWSIIDCRYYRGDFRKSLDWSVVDACVAAFKDAPVAYSLDMGVTSEGRTCVVEVNDALSLGTYGIPPIPYTQMVVDRWEQVVGLV